MPALPLRLPRLRTLLALAVVLGPAVAASAAPSVTRVSFAERRDGLGFVVRIHATERVQAYALDEREGAVVLTLHRAGVAPKLREDRPLGPITGYSARTSRDRVELTFTLAPGAVVSARAYPDGGSNDLLVALTPAAPARPVVAAPDAESRKHWELDCIVLDAGHGGHDGGTASHGVKEKDVVLPITRKVGEYVRDRLGMRVVYTRSSDNFVELHDRGRVANEKCGKLFVSIHANAAPGAAGRRAEGVETYFLGRGKSRDDRAREVMERENSVIDLESDPSLYDDLTDASFIMKSLAASAYQRESEVLAGLVQQELTGRAGRKDRGVRQAGFIVLWRASMPAILIETGFVSNPDEARFLKSEQGQDLIASAIFRAIRSYKEQYERGLGLAAH